MTEKHLNKNFQNQLLWFILITHSTSISCLLIWHQQNLNIWWNHQKFTPKNHEQCSKIDTIIRQDNRVLIDLNTNLSCYLQIYCHNELTEYKIRVSQKQSSSSYFLICLSWNSHCWQNHILQHTKCNQGWSSHCLTTFKFVLAQCFTELINSTTMLNVICMMLLLIKTDKQLQNYGHNCSE